MSVAVGSKTGFTWRYLWVFVCPTVQLSTSQSKSHLHFVKLLLIDTFQVEEGKDCQERNQGNA